MIVIGAFTMIPSWFAVAAYFPGSHGTPFHYYGTLDRAACPDRKPFAAVVLFDEIAGDGYARKRQASIPHVRERSAFLSQQKMMEVEYTGF